MASAPLSEAAAPLTATPSQAGGRPAGYVAYAMAMLVLVSVFNLLDRQLPFILAEAIKADLKLSDTQLGLLGGIAFAFFYSTLALPLARLADTWSPKWVLTGSLLVWNGLTALGGLSQGFWQLAGARVGVAAGEAGSTPAGHALISALVSPARRGLALGVFSMGVPVGVMAGLILGGWLNDLRDWRFAMVTVGLAGMALAVLFALTVPDARPARPTTDQPTFAAVARRLFGLKSFRHLFAGMTVFGVGAYGIFAFAAPFLIRTYGLSASEGGLLLGLSQGLAGCIGALGGGWLGDVVGRKSPGRTLLVPTAGFVIAAPFLAAAWFAPNAALSIACLTVPLFSQILYIAPGYSVAHSLATPAMRATATAILLLGVGLAGASLGPLLVGMVSDALEPRFGSDSLRYALCLAVVTDLWAAGHLLIAARALPADLARLKAAEGVVAPDHAPRLAAEPAPAT